jgi:hypothetical protein
MAHRLQVLSILLLVAAVVAAVLEHRDEVAVVVLADLSQIFLSCLLSW